MQVQRWGSCSYMIVVDSMVHEEREPPQAAGTVAKNLDNPPGLCRGRLGTGGGARDRHHVCRRLRTGDDGARDADDACRNHSRGMDEHGGVRDCVGRSTDDGRDDRRNARYRRNRVLTCRELRRLAAGCLNDSCHDRLCLRDDGRIRLCDV